ncbi:MAG: four helix bundle protein, partial [Bacteroidales bacterium]|nr:four helix bundle protein [Bacteroidales bacterium]
MATKSFMELDVWKKSHQLVLGIYKATKAFPAEEIYGLTSQIRRAVISVPSNIAEGYKRLTKSEKIRYFNIAQSSLEEVKYYLFLARELDYYNTSDDYNCAEEIGKMLDAYIILMLFDFACLPVQRFICLPGGRQVEGMT